MSRLRAGRDAIVLLPALDRLLPRPRLARARRDAWFVAEHQAKCFPAADAAWNGIGRARDGTIYCAAGTHAPECGARLFALAPGSSAAELVAELDSVLPRPQARAIPQGKVHVDLAPTAEGLLGATHIAYYARQSGLEHTGTSAAYGPYPVLQLPRTGRGLGRMAELVKAVPTDTLELADDLSSGPAAISELLDELAGAS